MKLCSPCVSRRRPHRALTEKMSHARIRYSTLHYLPRCGFDPKDSKFAGRIDGTSIDQECRCANCAHVLRRNAALSHLLAPSARSSRTSFTAMTGIGAAAAGQSRIFDGARARVRAERQPGKIRPRWRSREIITEVLLSRAAMAFSPRETRQKSRYETVTFHCFSALF